MTNLAKFLQKKRRPHLSSIFRRRKVASKEDDGEEETVRLEESQSELSSCISFSVEPVVVPSTITEAEATTATQTTRKHVSFKDVTVRHYDLILGDNPYNKYPLSLGWNYRQHETETIDVEAFEEARDRRLQQRANDRIQPRLYVPPEGLGDPASGVTTCHYLSDVHTEEDFDDHLSKLLSELTLQERRIRLRSYGYSEAYLRKAERQRRVALALEYSVNDGDDKKNGGSATLAQPGPPTPGFPYSPKFITRYNL